MITHVVNWQVVNGDVVHYHTLFAVLTKNIVAHKVPRVHQQDIAWEIMK